MEPNPVEVPEPRGLDLLCVELGEAEVRARLMRLQILIAEGKGEVRILKETGWQPAELGLLRRELTRIERALLVRPTEELYVEYLLRQEKNLSDLNSFVENWQDHTEAVPSVVSAIRARAEILDKVIQRGQDLGIIQKAVTRKALVVGGVRVEDLGTREIRELIVKQLEGLRSLTTQVRNLDELGADAGAVEVQAEPVEALTPVERVRRIAGTGISRAKAARAKIRERIREDG